jgi:hypothetical protein
MKNRQSNQDTRPMDRQALVDSIAYCGLVCGRCHLRAECDFCKNTASLCARSKVCYQRNCCIQKDLQGNHSVGHRYGCPLIRLMI